MAAIKATTHGRCATCARTWHTQSFRCPNLVLNTTLLWLLRNCNAKREQRLPSLQFLVPLVLELNLLRLILSNDAGVVPVSSEVGGRRQWENRPYKVLLHFSHYSGVCQVVPSGQPIAVKMA